MSRRYTMKGEAQNFKWFKDRIFEIPFFQRPYVWKEDNWEELWNNIVLNSAEEMPFIGSFILQIKDDRGLVNYIVIDGQQRLTTLSILIKAFFNLLMEKQFITSFLATKKEQPFMIALKCNIKF